MVNSKKSRKIKVFGNGKTRWNRGEKGTTESLPCAPFLKLAAKAPLVRRIIKIF